jgi:cytochrome c-type biogenesis protein CcmH/NrfG
MPKRSRRVAGRSRSILALAPAWCQLGETLAHQNNMAEAIGAWQKALDLDPTLG